MNYTTNKNNNQQPNGNFLKVPCTLERFHNTTTILGKDSCGRDCYYINGYVEPIEDDFICDFCGKKMHVHDHKDKSLKYLPMLGNYSVVNINVIQFKCPHCNATKMQSIPFKEDNHLITIQLKTFTEDLLASNEYTNKQVAQQTGLNRNLVKEIDKERLKKIYTKNGEGKELINPEQQAKFLGIDEFKLHDGNKYATHIIDLETGHVLWIAKGKKKQVVYDFIKHVGYSWMSKVIAVACDMNSDFEEAFKEECPHLKIVYDYFHIMKNLNEKVISNIRKDEQKRLIKEGKLEEAKKFKKSKYILVSSRQTLIKKDQEVRENKVISKGSALFNEPEITRKGNYEEKYNDLINENELLLIVDFIKELLYDAFHTNNKSNMKKSLFDIMELCEESQNKHLLYFKNLLYNHYDGIITHAEHNISSGKIEGINNKIKTKRRQAYGYPDDEYFFLKVIDMSRH